MGWGGMNLSMSPSSHRAVNKLTGLIMHWYKYKCNETSDIMHKHPVIAYP